MTKAGERLIEGMKEAVAIASGEQPADAIWVDGFKYVPAERVERLEAELSDVKKNEETLGNDLRRAISIGPRCGNTSLFLVLDYRARGVTLEMIGEKIGLTKGAVWQAIKKAEKRLSSLHEPATSGTVGERKT